MQPSDPDHRPLDPARKAAMRELIEHAVANEVPRSRRLRAPIVAGVGAAAVLVGGSATAYVLTQRPVTETSLVHCFSRAELTAGGEFPGVSVAAAHPSDGTVPMNEAVETCARVWRDGLLDPAAPIGASLPEPDQQRTTEPPSPLTVCVMPDGSGAVVPGGPGVCAELDLPLQQE